MNSGFIEHTAVTETSEVSEAVKACQKVFTEAIARRNPAVWKNGIFHSLPKSEKHEIIRVFRYGDNAQTVTVDEYADYENIVNGDFLSAAESMIAKALNLYDSLVYAAQIKNGKSYNKSREFHATAFDESTVDFSVVVSTSASVADPEYAIKGWAAFRLRFAAAHV